MTWLRVRNWQRFQHYKDRNPEWIKLYINLLHDYNYTALPEAARAHLVMIWLVATKRNGSVPADAEWLGRQISATSPVDLDLLVERGFLEPAEDAGEFVSPWPSRHVSPALRAKIMARDGQQCRECGATEDLEIDHLTPVSRGGESIEENLQVLCRPCNRRKRTRSPAEQVATQPGNPAEPRDREETEKNYTTATAGVRVLIPAEYREDFDNQLRASHRPDALIRELKQILEGDQPACKGATGVDVGMALRDAAMAGKPLSGGLLRGFVRGAVTARQAPAATVRLPKTPTDDYTAVAAKLRAEGR